MRKNKLCLFLTLLLSLFAPVRAVAVTYQMCSGQGLCKDFAAPTTRNKSVDIMFKHNAHNYAQGQRTHSGAKGTANWEVYSTQKQNTVNAYGSTYPTMAAAGSHSASSSRSKQYVPYFSASKTSQLKGFRTRSVSSNSTAQNLIIPNSTRMNVYVAGESEEDGNGNYWDDEEEDWLPIPGGGHNVGDKDFHDGKWWYWNGTGWIEIAEVTPVGDVPYIMVMLLMLLYTLLPIIRKIFKRSGVNTTESK